MNRRLFVAVFVLACLSSSSAVAQEVTGPPEWRQFRDAYPYLVQGIALSRPRTDGSRVLIVAEPPPHVGRAQLSSILGTATSVEFPAQPIGYDGWARDAVAVIPAGRDVKGLIEALHRELFGTSYKAYLLPITTSPRMPVTDAAMLNLQVSATDLARWLLPAPSTAGQRALRFTGLGSATTVTASDILDRGLTGVFVSREPGIVLCALSSASPLANARLELRQFVVDSDLILGGLRKGQHVVIVGRERILPVTVLPPLRVETILQLASVGQDKLSQSYERKNIIAGRYDDTHDWAPIYLSPVLVDTEYGSLLNITDQLLKSWSMGGVVHYEQFGYPAPASYPFPVPLPEYVNATRVTFNWNTKGAGYVLRKGGVDILALNRTGALPIDYLGGENARVARAEDIAYSYFTSTGDPNLVRVVQYASLYQLFRRYGVTTPAERSATPLATPPAARKGVDAFVRELRKLDADKIAAAIEESSTGAKAHPALAEALSRLLVAKLGVDILFKRGGDTLLARLDDALAAPRDFNATTPDDQMALDVALTMMEAPLSRMLDVPLGQIKEDYVAESARAVDGWIRTPSIVVSWVERSDRKQVAIGGHNLRAETSSLRPDPAVPAGDVRVANTQKGRVLRFNPADESRIASVVRQFGRGEEKPRAALEGELRTVLKRAPAAERPLVEALALTPRADGARGLTAAHVPTGSVGIGWNYGDSGLSPAQLETIAALADPQTPVWVVERSDSGAFSIYNTAGRQILTAGHTQSAADGIASLIGGQPPQSLLRVHIRGLDANQAKGLMQSLEARLPPERRGRLAGTVEDRALGPQDLRQILGADYDFTRARVSRVSQSLVTPEGTRLDVDVTVPAKMAEKPSLRMRIRLLFRSIADVSAQVMSSVEQVVRGWVGGLDASLSAGALRAAKERLCSDLQRVHLTLEADIVVNDSVLISTNLHDLGTTIPTAA